MERNSPLPPHVAVVLYLLAAAPPGSGCPESCDCIWRHGKITVECTGKGLRAIPQKVDPQTQVLDLSENVFLLLPKETFLSSGLVNLQKLYLTRCRIAQINPRAFLGLTNLVELDLSGNALAHVPSSSFRSIPSLRILQLNANPIRKVPGAAFADVPSLVRIEMSRCEIVHISPGAFERLPYLESLKIDANRLISLDHSAAVSLRRLHSIHVHDNPWNCDCSLRPLWGLLMRHNVPFPEVPACAGPERMRGRSLDQVDVDELACPPEIVDHSEDRISARSGGNVSVTCRIRSVPRARVDWMHRGVAVATSGSIHHIHHHHHHHHHHRYAVAEHRGDDGDSDEDGELHTAALVSTLTLISVDEGSSGDIRCVVSNPAGSAEANFSLSVFARLPGAIDLSEGQVIGLTLSLILVIAFILTVVVFLLVRVHGSSRSQDEKKKQKMKKEESEGERRDGAAAATSRLPPKVTRGGAGPPGTPVARQRGSGCIENGLLLCERRPPDLLREAKAKKDVVQSLEPGPDSGSFKVRSEAVTRGEGVVAPLQVRMEAVSPFHSPAAWLPALESADRTDASRRGSGLDLGCAGRRAFCLPSRNSPPLHSTPADRQSRAEYPDDYGLPLDDGSPSPSFTEHFPASARGYNGGDFPLSAAARCPPLGSPSLGSPPPPKLIMHLENDRDSDGDDEDAGTEV